MKTETLIEVYNTFDDTFVAEFVVDSPTLKQLIEIIPPKPQDSGYYSPVKLNNNQLDLLEVRVNGLSKYLSREYECYLRTVAIR